MFAEDVILDILDRTDDLSDWDAGKLAAKILSRAADASECQAGFVFELGDDIAKDLWQRLTEIC